MAIGQYPRRTSGNFIVKHCKLSWFDHVCRHDTLPKIAPVETVGGSGRQNLAGATSTNGQTSQCYRCCTLQTTEILCATIAVEASVGVRVPNDASVSQVLASFI